MRTSTYLLCTILGLAALCHLGLTSPIVKRQVLDNPSYIDPAQQDLEDNQEQDRGKRKIEGAIELANGAKSAVLGLIFNHTYKWLLAKPKFFNFNWPVARHRRSAEVPSAHVVQKRQGNVETTTPDYVDFTPGQKVSLEVPGELFGSGFTLISNISQVVGSLIQNSAERTARIFESMKPFLQAVFGVRSLVITRDGPQDNKV